MSQERLAPQQPEECLIQSRKSSCKGGTLIAGDVWTRAEHRKRLSDPDQGYRRGLGGCRKCGHPKLHVHDYRERKALGLLALVAVMVVRFICANPECGATWQVLPAFVARHLWWTWSTVEHTTAGAEAIAPVTSATTTVVETAAESSVTSAATTVVETPAESPVTSAATTVVETTTPGAVASPRVPSTRTQQRWAARLRASANQLVTMLAACGDKAVQAVAEALRAHCTRADLVQCHAQMMGIAAGRRYGVVAALVDDLERGIRLM